jgi:hypothetical protein
MRDVTSVDVVVPANMQTVSAISPPTAASDPTCHAENLLVNTKDKAPREEILLEVAESGQELWGYADSDTGGITPHDEGAISDPSPSEGDDEDDEDPYLEEPSVRAMQESPAVPSVTDSATVAPVVGAPPARHNATGKRKARRPSPTVVALPVTLNEGTLSMFKT